MFECFTVRKTKTNYQFSSPLNALGKQYEIIRIKQDNQSHKTIDIQIDPDDLENSNDKFTLYSTDKNRTYRITLSCKDDLIPDDDFTTLQFINLDPNLSYTLEVYSIYDKNPYKIFSNVLYTDLKKAEEQEGYLIEENEEPEENMFDENVDEFDLFDEYQEDQLIVDVESDDEDGFIQIEVDDEEE